MTDNTDDDQDEGHDDDSGEATSGGERSEEFKKLVDDAANDKVAKIKSSLNDLNKKLEAETKARVRAEKDAADVKRNALKADGKDLEAAQMKIAELEEELKITSGKLVSVTRDREVDTALTSLEFRNAFAKSQASDFIAKDLVLDNDGTWVHKSGASIPDYIKSLPKNEDFAATYLKAKDNSGTNAPGNRVQGGPKGKPKSVLGMSTEELMAWATAQNAAAGL